MRLLDKAAFLARLRLRQGFDHPQAEAAVREVVARVRGEGDAALCEYTRRFDGVDLRPDQLEVRPEEFAAARAAVSGEFLRALRQARDNVLAFHRAERRASWWRPQPDGTVLGQLVTPVRRAGLYVPGGTAPLVSTVLMLAVPAQVAGVPEIVLCTPPGRDGRIDPHVLVAAAEAGVHRVFRLGGAQAIAAMAYGTATVPRVDKIAGPGNIYVTLAKKLCYGDAGIDGLMGPSEVAVLAEDGIAPPEWIAADLLSQAEHDTLAASYLVTTSAALAQAVTAEVERQLDLLPRADIARRSLEHWGAAVVVGDLCEGVELCNEIAPEHLQLLVREPAALLGRITAAGAVFCGPWSPEPVGDYAAGPSHVLPTAGVARYASVVGTATFQKETSLIWMSREGFSSLARSVVTLAEVEGLEAHARSIRVRGVGLDENGKGAGGR